MKMYLIAMIVLLFSGCQAASNSAVTSSGAATTIKEVSPSVAKPAVDKAYSQFIDVRTTEEYASGHAERAVNIPLDTLTSSLDRLEKNEPVYIICQTGNRSRKAAQILVDAGYKDVYNITGGTTAWAAANFPLTTNSPTAPIGGLDEKTKKALLSALEDERRAQATYRAVLNKFANARPFINVVEAEKVHESLLLPLFAKYGVPVPVNEFDPVKVTVPDSLAEACKVAVNAENENIALYDGFFTFVKEPDVKEVFLRLQSASRDNHLPAFTRCSEGGMGNGPGGRRLR